MAEKAIITTETDLRAFGKEIVTEALKAFKEEQDSQKVYFVNQVAKILKKHPNTIKKYCQQGLLKTNDAGLITAEALNDFFKVK